MQKNPKNDLGPTVGKIKTSLIFWLFFVACSGDQSTEIDVLRRRTGV